MSLTWEDVKNAASDVGDWFKKKFEGVDSSIDNALTGERDYQRTVDLQNANNAFNAEQARLNRQWQTDELYRDRLYNSAEAERNRQWQTYMSNTAVQRQVTDLRNAGFNPLGMIGDGASVGSGATARGSVTSGSAANATPVAQMRSNTNLGDTVYALSRSALALKHVGDQIKAAGNALKGSYNVGRMKAFANDFKVVERRTAGLLSSAAARYLLKGK